MYQRYEPMKRFQSRIEAVRKIKEDSWSVDQVVSHFGFSERTIYRWLLKWFFKGYPGLADQSRRPKQLRQPTPWEIQLKIRTIRKKHGWCHQTISLVLAEERIQIAPVTVYRILKKAELIKPRKKQPRRPNQEPRPYPIVPGTLVQADTKWLLPKRSFYQYSFVDAASRFVYATLDRDLNMVAATKALKTFTLPIRTQVIQTDNGLEFQETFQKVAHSLGYQTRFTHRSSPEENGRVERFHRTVDDEFYGRTTEANQAKLQAKLTEYLNYYNYERPHLALQGKSPYKYIQELQGC